MRSWNWSSNVPPPTAPTADRYRQLLDEATTPELTQYFSEMIARFEALAREGEASE